ncbi:MAG: hypothetical protein VKM01_09390 [Cyanobacteriota bacterium]|nr:hypothetical protein [Cyanobacteriota bacterium]
MFLLRSSLGLAFGSLVLSLTPGVAQAVSVVTVNVGGTNYDLTTFEGSYNSNTAKFATPANNGAMPWWGDPALAEAISSALGTQFGLPNTSGPAPVAPWVGFNLVGPPGNLFLVERYSQEVVLGQLYKVSGDPAQFSVSTTWVQLAPAAPAPVPGPLPLFGVAAAFSMRRRLSRLSRRIQLGG